MHFFTFICRGMCSFGKIYDLRDGLRFLEKYKTKGRFIKAAKEMAIIIQEQTNEKNIADFSDIVEKYTNLLKH